MRFNHVASGIVHADHGIIVSGCKTFLLFHDYRRAFATGVEKVLRHSFRQANATVRRSIPRNIALVHCVATVEMHAVGHLRAIEMCPRRLSILARINVRFHDVTVIIDVITKFAGNVVPIFGNNVIAARRRGKPRFAGRDSRLADHALALVEISSLFPEINDDLGRARPLVALPITGRRSLPRESSGA